MQSATSEARSANALALQRATLADIEAIVALVNGAYRGEEARRGWTTEEHLLGGQRTDPEGIAAILQAPGQALLTLRDREGLCACVHLEAKDGGICYLGMLTVRPDLQTAGIGRQMLAAAESHAREHFGADVIEMTVIDLRLELIAWYERRGYRHTGELRPFPYGDERFGLPRRPDLRFTVMRRRLGAG